MRQSAYFFLEVRRVGYINRWTTLPGTVFFIAGLSWPFSYASQLSKGIGHNRMYYKIAKRVIILFLLGLVYNGLLKNWNLYELRYYSVLARIGFCWAISCILFMHFSRRVREVIAVILLVGYYLLLRFVPVPGAILVHLFEAPKQEKPLLNIFRKGFCF